ncbi:MAG: AEC family transporter [Lachnospiraceae bacterium]|nr:AEC family transporter [Lachnospiraceae bacterium]
MQNRYWGKEGKAEMGTILLQSGVLILIMVLGYVSKKARLFGKWDYRIVTKLVMYFTLPCAIVTNFASIEWKNSLFVLPVFGLAVNIVLQFTAWLFCRKGSDEDKIFYMLNMPGFSMGTFALPFIQNSLGMEGVVAACMFDAGGTIMPSGASYVCAEVVLKEKEKKERTGVSFVAKRMLSSPPFLMYLCMVPLKIFDMEVPHFVLAFTEKVSGANAFLCMVMIGMMFELKLKKEHLKKTGKLLITRVAFSAALAVLIFKCGIGDEALRKALAVVIFSPIAALSLIFTDRMEGDAELAGFVNSVSIVISMVVMTVLLMVL